MDKKPTIDLAIIIPTLNEEHYIGKLLDSIAMQSVLPKEVVVIDAMSADKTIAEIQKRQTELPQLKYYQIPKYTIARQRNFGVQKTQAANLLFLDADMMFKDPQTVKQYYNESVAKKAGFAVAKIEPLSSRKRDKLLYYIMYMGPRLFKPVKAYATTMNLFVTRDLFERVGGFDEEIKIAEDFEFLARLRKAKGKFVILKNPVVYNSVRRLEKDGRIGFVILLWISLFFILFVGYKKNPMKNKYDFGKHPKLD